MTQDKKFLGTEPVGRLLWKLAGAHGDRPAGEYAV